MRLFQRLLVVAPIAFLTFVSGSAYPSISEAATGPLSELAEQPTVDALTAAPRAKEAQAFAALERLAEMLREVPTGVSREGRRPFGDYGRNPEAFARKVLAEAEALDGLDAVIRASESADLDVSKTLRHDSGLRAKLSADTETIRYRYGELSQHLRTLKNALAANDSGPIKVALRDAALWMNANQATSGFQPMNPDAVSATWTKPFEGKPAEDAASLSKRYADFGVMQILGSCRFWGQV